MNNDMRKISWAIFKHDLLKGKMTNKEFDKLYFSNFDDFVTPDTKFNCSGKIVIQAKSDIIR